jgi:CysZ protein
VWTKSITMINEFLDGLKAYGKAFRVISKLGLWGYTLLPALLTLAIMVGVGFTAYGLSDNIGNFLVSWWRWDWGAEVVASIGSWVGGILIGILGILSLKYIVLILVAPFMSILSEKVESKLTGVKSTARFTIPKAIQDIIRGFRISLRNIIRELFFTFLLLIAGMIPLIGWISPIFIFLVQSYYAGFGNTDYTMERHFKVRKSVHFARQHKGLMIGNGVVFMALLMTGVGFLIAPPLATVAATLESVERLETAGCLEAKGEEFV